MAGDRYVVLALSTARAGWLGAISRWANAGSIAVDVVKCVSVEEVRARLSSARPYSALLVDAGMHSVDRDLVDAAAAARCPVIAVAGRTSHDVGFGAAAVLGDGFSADVLIEMLRRTAVTVAAADVVVHAIDRAPNVGWRASVAALCGSGGTGTSTLAVALAQTLADDPRHGGLVLLADLCLRADQAMLHDAVDLTPALQELVEAHRRATPALGVVREHTFAVSARGYRLLLGLRRARNWPALRRRPLEAAFDGLALAHRVVVCDTDADVEGERECGSLDVEDRNVMARTSLRRANAVFVVGLPSLKGVHSMVQVIDDVVSLGVDAARVVPVFNRAPRTMRSRHGLASALASLLPDHVAVTAPVFVPERPVESALYDGTRLPDSLGTPLADAFDDVLAATTAPSVGTTAERVTPGSLGSWSEDEEVAG